MESSICNIEKILDLANLLKVTKLITWDGASLINKFYFEALDKSLKDIMSDDNVECQQIFGGKVVIFGGDFRQILPIVPRGTRSDVVHATINASYIWDHCKVLNLTKNMRLQSGSNLGNSEEIMIFSYWILQVGNGKVSEPNDGYVEIDIPEDLLIRDFVDPIQAIVISTYLDLLQNYTSPNFL
ncbi:uncharacterized protein LOC127079468 [Lathyrus oleraceus]|uniref:uncharacterized protein LOC127079468 n=1 Tax=Pisum sativum TaxID=3888 RepID=UPI0021D0EBCC|nr:uncharacterized protein LOC127079468 [Pisum sativum]